nr:histidine kinase [bacterium]
MRIDQAFQRLKRAWMGLPSTKRVVVLCVLVVWIPAMAACIWFGMSWAREEQGQAGDHAQALAETAGEQLCINLGLAPLSQLEEAIPHLAALCDAGEEGAFAERVREATVWINKSLRNPNVLESSYYYRGPYTPNSKAVLLYEDAPQAHHNIFRLMNAREGLIYLEGALYFVANNYVEDIPMNIDATVVVRLPSEVLDIALDQPVIIRTPGGCYSTGSATDNGAVHNAVWREEASVRVEGRTQHIFWCRLNELGVEVAVLSPLPFAFPWWALVCTIVFCAMLTALSVAAVKWQRRRNVAFLRQLETLAGLPDAGEITGDEKDIDWLLNRLAGKLARLDDEATINRRLHREAEMKALQMQLNPHLLYNALSSISWMARESGQHAIVDTVTRLARFYRASLGGKQQMGTVKSELQHVQDYLDIHRLAMDDFYEVEIEASPSVMDIPMLHLLLQPVVENAVVHGLEGKRDGGGKLSVKVTLEYDILVCKIGDNGCGMTQEQIDQLMEGDGKGYGFSMVRDRLRYFYGDQAGLRIESQVGIGTLVTLWMPAMPDSIK